MTVAAPAYPYVRSFFVAQNYRGHEGEGSQSGGPTFFGRTLSAARGANSLCPPYSTSSLLDKRWPAY